MLRNCVTLLLCFLVSVKCNEIDFDVGCGQRKVQHEGLVVRGSPSRPGDWPWHVALRVIENKMPVYKCGGSIIAPNAILTAAHCVFDPHGRRLSSDLFLVQLGKYNLNLFSTYSQEHEVASIIVHEKYDDKKLVNDIAILKLKTAAKFTDYVQPICLWKEENDDINKIVGKLGTVVGWGVTENNSVSDILAQLTMPVVSFYKCLESNRDFFGATLHDNTYCSGYKNGSNVCNGDSGGGMFFKIDNEWHIRGIVSFTAKKPNSNNCDPKEYVVFTDISSHKEWIINNLDRVNQAEINDFPTLSLINNNNCGPNWNSYDKVESEKPLFLQYPWLALLEYHFVKENLTRVLCHGALINDKYVLTTAHCMRNLPKAYNLVSVRLGEFDIDKDVDCVFNFNEKSCAPSTQVIPIESYIAHPQFNKPKFANDIALLRLAHPANISSVSVHPICLPTSDFLMKLKLDSYVETGWRKSGVNSEVLNRRKAVVVDSELCRDILSEQSIPFDKTNGQICVENELQDLKVNQRKNCSFIMAGAPLQVISSLGFYEQYILYGLLSFAPTKCDDNSPEVFTNVQRYLRWILLNIEA